MKYLLGLLAIVMLFGCTAKHKGFPIFKDKDSEDYIYLSVDIPETSKVEYVEISFIEKDKTLRTAIIEK